MKNEDWQSVYGSSLSPNPKNTKFNQRQSLGNGNIYIYCCEFNDCAAGSQNGGAICVSSSSSTKLLVEKTLFFRCKTTTSGEGGAIYFGSEGNCVISQVCGNECSTPENRPFSYVDCTNGAQYKNDILDSSISLSTSSYFQAISNWDGKIEYNGLNSSFNTCGYNTACGVWTSRASDVTGTISFCSFINNTATTCRILIIGNNANNMMKSCNVIKNEQKDKSNSGIIHSDGVLEIKDSCILENIATYELYGGSSTNTITVYNCTLDPNINSKKNNYVTIASTVSNSFILALVHLSTGNCEAKFDSVGSLSPAGNKRPKRNFCITQNAFFKMRPTVDVI